jgi:cell division protein FtsN
MIMKTFTVVFLYFFIFTGVANVHAQSRGGAFAAAATPGQPAVPPVVTPQPTTPARPAGQAQPTQQQQEQLRIVGDPATNSLIIYGTAQEFQNIKNILKELDAIPRQVLLDVMVAEVTLSDNESFGVAYEIFRGQNSIFGQTFSSTGAVVNPTISSSPAAAVGNVVTAALTGFPAGMSGVIGRGNAIRAFINALASQNRIRALASPSILATDNRPARIQVGNEIPILTGQTSTFTGTSTPLTSNAIQYRNTGVILTVIPQVNSQGLVNLQVKQEVSDVEFQTFGSTGSPSFTTRDAETNAVVQDGETLAIGGIIQEKKSRDRTGIPYLMDIPVLGRFFGTTSDQSKRTELVILITPHVSRNIEESRSVTQELKNRLSDVKNELDRLAREREKTQPRPRPQQLPPMPDPNQYYRNEEAPPQPAPSSVVPGSGAMAPSSTGAASNFQPPDRNNEVIAPKPQGFALSLVPMRSEAPAVTIKKPDERASVAKLNRVWAVQVAALAENKDAESFAEKLRREGHQAYVLTSQVDNKTWHRVRVGRFENQQDAQELKKTLAASKSYQHAYVALN